MFVVRRHLTERALAILQRQTEQICKSTGNRLPRLRDAIRIRQDQFHEFLHWRMFHVEQNIMFGSTIHSQVAVFVETAKVKL